MKVILVLTGLGIVTLLAEMFKLRKLLFPIVILGMLAAIGTAASYWWYDDGALTPYLNGAIDGNHHIPTAGFGISSMIVFGPSSILFSIVMLVTALLWFIMAGGFFKEESSQSDHYALVIFSLTGAILLTCYANMVMLFLGIEILSIPLYVLAGSKKDSLASNEAAFKYFLLGAFASAFLLFGIALIYGCTGSFDLRTIGSVIHNGVQATGLLYGGIVLILVGLLFKVSAAPFHFWAPDVYQGSPTPVTAFMSTIVKTAAIVAIMRLFVGPTVFGTLDGFWNPLVAVLVGLTIIVGNLSAVVQTSVKRMLAYSSISHAGFLLMAIVAFSSAMAMKANITPKVLLYYTAAYSIASLTAFTVLLSVMKQTGGDAVDSFNGLAKKNPLLAVTMTVALLSLAGIPPTAGFFAKYYVLTAAFTTGHYSVAIIGILGSLIGVYYYFRIVIAMFFKSPDTQEVTAESSHQGLLFITAVLTLVLGLLPDLLLNLGSLPTAAAN